MSPSVRLTAPRRKALEVLAYGARHNLRVEESNRTGRFIHPGGEQLVVYWQVAGWLEEQGYITKELEWGRWRLDLTDLGRELASEVAPT